MTPLCAAGRIFDPAHPTCRTCKIGCAAKSIAEVPTLDEIGKKHGLPGRKKKMKKQPKYRNRKVVMDGETFDSSKEAARFVQLKMLEAIGAVKELTRQKAFPLVHSVILDGRRKPAVKYISDFYYFDADKREYVVEDCKSEITRKLPVYRLKKHMLKAFMNLDILET